MSDGTNQPPPSTPSSSQGQTPAQAPSLGNPGPEQCITPPSQRRREARIAHCQNIYAQQAEAIPADPEVIRDGGYQARELDTRVVDWREWEQTAERTYQPVNAGRVLGPDGLVRDWEVVAPGRFVEGADNAMRDALLGQNGGATYRDFLQGIEATPSTWEQARFAHAQAVGAGAAGVGAQGVPSLDAGLTGPATGLELPSNTVAIALTAAYIVARAMGFVPGVARRRRRRDQEGLMTPEGKASKAARR
ncbi:BQ5605_C001g00405 [Microbotryum silenes-dioicae]|uniref:BQ5605_C001g00405 protein n=1 Tax=Microbotryum silenes-dioicae TaxID=796604 RepID=A0A2X0P5S1_9BASI|nr:BQ5605_C001g00405 [Microbotryum silenes-dioicae]